jgi:hypothetical protein
MRVALDHVVHEPVVHLRGARFAHHDVQLVTLERFRAADQDRQQSRRSVIRLPELACEVLLRLQPLRERAQFAEVHTVVVAVFLVRLPCLRVLERGQFGHHLGHRRLGHLSLLPIVGDPAYEEARPPR